MPVVGGEGAGSPFYLGREHLAPTRTVKGIPREAQSCHSSHLMCGLASVPPHLWVLQCRYEVHTSACMYDKSVLSLDAAASVGVNLSLWAVRAMVFCCIYTTSPDWLSHERCSEQFLRVIYSDLWMLHLERAYMKGWNEKIYKWEQRALPLRGEMSGPVKGCN